MAFETYENSVEQSEPFELYQFSYQGGTFRFTSDAKDHVQSGVTWTRVPGLSRTAIEDSGDISKSSLTLTAPEDFQMSLIFETYPPSDVVELEVFRVQRSDPTDVKTMWIGRILNATWGVGFSTLLGESLITRLKQPGLRRIYSKNCPHLLYGSDCRASQIAFEEEVTLEGVLSDGFQLLSSTFDTFVDGFFAGGKIEYDAGGGNIFRRGIREHVGSLITLTHPIPGLPTTATISAWPGCDRTKATCVSKFANLENYGGFPYMTQKNPFGQNSIY